jgi:hypothetical protein
MDRNPVKWAFVVLRLWPRCRCCRFRPSPRLAFQKSALNLFAAYVGLYACRKDTEVFAGTIAHVVQWPDGSSFYSQEQELKLPHPVVTTLLKKWWAECLRVLSLHR